MILIPLRDNWPVDQKAIDVVQTQHAQRIVQTPRHVLLRAAQVKPDFGRDENIGPFGARIAREPVAQRLTYFVFVFVAVYCGEVPRLVISFFFFHFGLDAGKFAENDVISWEYSQPRTIKMAIPCIESRSHCIVCES